MKEIYSLRLKKTVKNVLEALWDNSVLSGLQKAINKYSPQPKIIILLYHNIVSDQAPDRAYFNKICLTTDDFGRQMAYLAQNCRIISLSHYIAMLRNTAPKMPESGPFIIITFDDGYQSVFTQAYPILRQLGLPATLFVATGFIGTNSELPGESRYPGINYPKLSWDEVGELARNGFEIGSHTITHAHPDQSNIDQYLDEISRSAEEITDRIGLRPVHFSWPYGKIHTITRELEPLLSKTGYISASYACGGKNSFLSHPLRLNRIGISTGISFTHFRRITEGINVTDCLTRKR